MPTTVEEAKAVTRSMFEVKPAKSMFDNYWLADDGRMYGSAKQAMTTAADPDYVAWTSVGNSPTPWPRDDAGEQTTDALQKVLTPFGLSADLTYYTAEARQRKYAGDIVVNNLPFSTDPVSLGGLNAAMLYTSDKVVDDFSWKLPDGTFITLSAAKVKELQSVVAAFGQACFVCEDNTLTAIENGTITTREQVDAAFAAVQNVFTSATTFGKTRHGKRK